MNSKIALHENSDSNVKTTDANLKHRRALQVLQNQQHQSRKGQIKKQKHLSDKSISENQTSFASRIESLKNFKDEIFNDMSNSSDDFDDENFRDIMKKFENYNSTEKTFDLPRPTSEEMDEIFIHNTIEAKQNSNHKFPFDPSENDPEFGRVQ